MTDYPTGPAHELDAYLRALTNLANDSRHALAGRDVAAELPKLVAELSRHGASVLLTRAEALAYRDLASSLDRWDVVLQGPGARVDR